MSKNKVFAYQNKDDLTYSIFKNGNHYLTARMTAEEFEEASYNTPGDWEEFLKKDQSYTLVEQ